jgi:hypothetical protein
MSLNEIKNRLEALDGALLGLLAMPIEGISLQSAAEYGNRINVARKVLRGEVETESMTFTQKWEAAPKGGHDASGH